MPHHDTLKELQQFRIKTRVFVISDSMQVRGKNLFSANYLETIHKYLIHLSINSKHYDIVIKVGMLIFSIN